VAAALSIIQLGCTLLLTVVYTGLSRRVSRPLSLRPRVFTARRLHMWRSRLWAGALIGLLFALLTLPLLALAARSFTRLEADRGQFGPVQRGLTLDFYQELGINRQSSIFYAPPLTAIGISLAYAAATVALSLALGIPASWALAQPGQAPVQPEQRPKQPEQALIPPGQALSPRDQALSPPPKARSPAVNGLTLANRLFDPLLMLPLGTSAVTLGLGFIVALDTPPLDLRASPLLVPLAHTLVAFPFVVRSLAPALRSIRPRLRHTAQVLGASPLQAFRLVDLPLAGRAILVAATYAFTISLGEFGATALIARPEYPTVPVAIYRFLSRPGALNYGQALALSTILMVVTAAGMLAIERFRIAEIGEF
jgi:thiamine transport system permease protein